MNKLLLILLFLLMIYIDKDRGIRLFISLLLNFGVLMITFYLTTLGFNPIVVSILACLLVSYIILYFVNGHNIKTDSSFISVLLVLLFLIIGIVIITNISRIAGFGYEYYEEINMYSYDVHIDFTRIMTAVILFSLIGAIVDASIAISSALFEVYDNNKHLSVKELFDSGINIGKDILCTTTDTLVFAFLGDFMTLVIWFYKGNYSFIDIINSKTFGQEFIEIMFSVIGCLIVIPVTSYITSTKLKKYNRKKDLE